MSNKRVVFFCRGAVCVLLCLVGAFTVSCNPGDGKGTKSGSAKIQVGALQELVNRTPAGSTLDLSNYEITGSRDAVITNANVTLSNASMALGELTIQADGVALSGLTSVDKVEAAPELGEGDLKIINSNVDSLLINGGGVNSIHLLRDSVRNVTINKEGVRLCVGTWTNVGELSASVPCTIAATTHEVLDDLKRLAGDDDGSSNITWDIYEEKEDIQPNEKGLIEFSFSSIFWPRQMLINYFEGDHGIPDFVYENTRYDVNVMKSSDMFSKTTSGAFISIKVNGRSTDDYESAVGELRSADFAVDTQLEPLSGEALALFELLLGGNEALSVLKDLKIDLSPSNYNSMLSREAENYKISILVSFDPAAKALTFTFFIEHISSPIEGNFCWDQQDSEGNFLRIVRVGEDYFKLTRNADQTTAVYAKKEGDTYLRYEKQDENEWSSSQNETSFGVKSEFLTELEEAFIDITSFPAGSGFSIPKVGTETPVFTLLSPTGSSGVLCDKYALGENQLWAQVAEPKMIIKEIHEEKDSGKLITTERRLTRGIDAFDDYLEGGALP